MATGFARTSGANARALDWEGAEEKGRTRGNWLPLDALNDEQIYAGTPQLRAATAPAPHRESRPVTRPEWLRPTAPQQRAMPQTAPQVQNPKSKIQNPAQGVPVRTLAIAAGVAIFALVAYLGVSAALDWTRIKLDDLQYGRPRTVQLDAYVGQNEAEGMPSHFIAMNLNRRVTIVQLPGGDATKASVILGPYLFGQGEDLTPVELNAQDVNGDQKPDLVVSVKNEQLIYLNEGASFRLATAEERTAIQKAASSRQAVPNGASPVDGGAK